MYLPLSLVLLTILAVGISCDTETGPNVPEGDKPTNAKRRHYDDHRLEKLDGDDISGTLIQLESQEGGRRRERVISFFARKWRALLKTTSDVRIVKDSLTEGKIYYKIGTPFDAAKDFDSLRPVDVESVYSGVAGRVGNQGLMLLWRSENNKHPTALHLLSGDGTVMNFGFTSPNRVPRAILYFRDMDEAERYFHTVMYDGTQTKLH